MLIQSASNSSQGPMPVGLASNGGPAGVAAQEPPQAVQQPAAQQPSPAQLANEVGKINTALQQANKNLELNISVDSSTQKQVVKLTDKDTGDTLMQYPSETVLAISREIEQFQHGMLLKQQA